MNPTAKLLLEVARRLPRGSWPAARLLTQWMPELKTVPVPLKLLPGTIMQADLSEAVWIPLWRHGCYPHQLSEDLMAQQILQIGDVVWDVGANIGYTALLYADRVKTQGRVIAIEPSPKAYGYLRRSVETNPIITPLQLAVSRQPGEVFFTERATLDTSSITSSNDPGSIKVNAATLDSLWLEDKLPPPVFLKVDVEGFELDVFEGGSQLIGENLPFIEFEALSEDALATNLDVLRRISRDQYQFYRVSKDTRLVKLPVSDPTNMCNNYFAIPDKYASRFRAFVSE